MSVGIFAVFTTRIELTLVQAQVVRRDEIYDRKVLSSTTRDAMHA
jgi:hypothetical protein